MKKLYTILLLLTYGFCSGQNLVPNPSFETHTNCPHNIGGAGDFNYATPWFHANISPDYYNICDTTSNNLGIPNNAFGNQFARTGVAYAGFYSLNLAFPSDGREYIEVKLTDTLSIGVEYRVQFYVSLADVMWYSTNTIGAYFSPAPIINNTVGYFSYVPQIINSSSNPLTDKNNWILVSETFTAIGNEAYMMIGNFNLDSQSDTTFVGGTGWGNMYSYYYIDDISVYPDSITGIKETQKDNYINFYPNPFNDKLNIFVKENTPTEITLYDLSSRKLLQQTFTNSTTINTEQLAKGMYLYIVRNKSGIIKYGKVIKE